MNFRGKHILSIDQFERVDIETILAVSNEMEPYASRRRVTRVLEGAVLGNLFFEASTRSRISFGAAFNRLGGTALDTTGFQFSSMAKGESLFDTARVVAGYVDILVMRHPEIGSVHEFASGTLVPVINGGDGPGEHPTQALLDLYTIQKETGLQIDDFRGLRMAMVGDLKYGRTVHSLVKLLSLLDPMQFVFVTHEKLQLPEELVELARERGHRVLRTTDLDVGLANVDIIYMTRLQQERFTSDEEIAQYRGAYAINEAFYKRVCRPGTILMHPLPRDSRPGANELNNDLNRNPSLAIFRQTDNGIPVRMAIFALALGVEDQVHRFARDANWYRPPRYGPLDVR